MDKLILLYLTDPPVGCWRVQLSQLEQADQYAFEQLQAYTRQGLDAGGKSVFPADVELLRIISTLAFELRATPLRQAVASSASHPPAAVPEHPRETMQRPAKMQRTTPPQQQSTGTTPKSGSTRTPPSIPEALRQHVLKTDKNQPICWGYQLGTCPFVKTKPGMRCARGWHVCCYKLSSGKACQEGHSLKEHVQ
eukprot:6482926-Amphidinium_carterae.1